MARTRGYDSLMERPQFPNPHKFPPLDALSAMSARDLGWMLLPVLARWHQSRGFVPTELVRTLADQYAPRNMGVEELLLEGMGYLERIGYLTETMTVSGPWRMLMVTRAGRDAARDAEGPGAHASRALPAVELLHPTIAAEALPEIDRGPDHFADAIFKAYRAVEIAVRNAGGFANDKIGVPLMSAAFGPTGPLRDLVAEAGEAEAMRSLFAGAVGTFKNPVSHRYVDERDPKQAMRLLAFASVLLEIVDQRAASIERTPP
jgi:uncharacterized protein (TIGR02391 family)